MTVAIILEGQDPDIITCTADCTVHEAARRLANKRVGALPVIDEAQAIVGIFSERDLLYCIAAEGPDVLGRAVSTVMTSPAVTVGPDEPALRALSLMTRRRIRHLPVVDDGRMIGFVSSGDLVKFRMDRIEGEAEQMRDYIRSA